MKNKKLATPILLIIIFVLFNGFVVFAGQQQQEKLNAMRKTGVTTLNKIVDVKDYRKKEAKKFLSRRHSGLIFSKCNSDAVL
ncbi:MAG: hypothetical protein PUE18_05855 [Firmicutes bacterium]|nr:hypothetical protein [Bacillota bacterium]